MKTDRRGFIGALLTAPLAAKLLPRERTINWYVDATPVPTLFPFPAYAARDQYAPLLAPVETYVAGPGRAVLCTFKNGSWELRRA